MTQTNKSYSAIGVIEVNFLTNSIIILDEMLKTSEVRLIACEKRLGGRMVSMIVGGDTSAVNAAVESAKQMGQVVGEENIKVAVTISNPHKEIRKLMHLIQNPNAEQKLDPNQTVKPESTQEPKKDIEPKKVESKQTVEAKQVVENENASDMKLEEKLNPSTGKELESSGNKEAEIKGATDVKKTRSRRQSKPKK